MNNLHRELAPISAVAWADLEEEARRTFKRHVAGRRVVDVPEPGGLELSAITTGHLDAVAAPAEGDIARVLDGEIIWAPAIEGAFLLSTRGGDFELRIGQDLSIGYLSHDAASIQLYFQESLTFLVFTSEAVVALTEPQRPAG